MNKEFYNKIFLNKQDKSWDNAPGKKVLFNYILEKYGSGKNRIIDIGCGSGYFANEVFQINNNNAIYGFDYSSEAITGGVSLFPHLDLFVEDVHNHSWVEKGPFDLVISYGCFEHFSNLELVFKNLYDSLSVNGEFLLMIPTLGFYRTDRDDEGWYEDFNVPPQQQWNYKRSTWEKFFHKEKLELYDIDMSIKYGAQKTGNFYFGKK